MTIRLLLLSAFLWAAVGYAADTVDAKAPEVVYAPVVVDGETLFQVRSVKNLKAQARAEAIADRIIRLADDPYFDVDDIKLVSDAFSTDVMAGDMIVVSVLEPDATAAGVSQQELAARLADKIRSAITRYRHEHSVHNLLMGVLLALAITVLLGVFIYALNRFFDKAAQGLETHIHHRFDATRVRIFEFIIKGVSAGAVKLLWLLVLAGALYFYFSALLSFFPWTRAYADRLFGYVTEAFEQIGVDIWEGLPNAIFLLILVFVIRYLLNILHFFFGAIEKQELEIAGFFPEWAEPTYKISRFLILVFAVIIAYPYIPGSSSRAFEGISIFFGVLISLGSTSIIANMVAGVILTYMRGFRIGDVVKIADATGKVTAVTLLVTRLRTPKNVEITIPNSVLMGNQVTNYSFAAGERRLILPTVVTIGYDAPWRQVHSLLLLAAERTGQVLCDPQPFVLQGALDDFYVRYELNVYAATADNMPLLYSELHQNIQDAFNEYGVQIMSPHYLADPVQAKIVPREHWSPSPAA